MNNYDKQKRILEILKIFLTTRLVLIILMVLSNIILQSSHNLYKNVFELFDNEHYLSIAKNGYLFNMQFAFFPLTPFLIRVFSKIGFIIINQIFTILTGYLLYLLSKDVFKEKDTLFATVLWFISPISIFTCMFYSETLFVFLTLLAYYLYKNQKHYLLLGITLGLSVLTRSLGSMLFFTIFIFMFINMLKKKEKIKNIIMAYIPATIISCLYPIYLYIKTGNLFYFVDVQYKFWARKTTSIITIFFDSLKLLLKSPNVLYILNFVLTFAIIFSILYLIYKNRNKTIYYDMFLYALLTIISICSTIRFSSDATTSFYRYIYACFPIYFILPHRKWIKNAHIILTACITAIFLLGIYFF